MIVERFGDAEPEDAWDADDTVAEKVLNLFRRAAVLSLLAARLRIVTPLLRTRLALLVDDLSDVEGRL